MDIKFNYNDTISTVNSKKPEVVDLETKDPVLLKSNKSADTVLPISPNDTTINTDDVITSSDKRYTVEVTNPEDPHVIGHTRNFYRGRSFRFAGIWTKGIHYICDEYVVDFVVKDNTLLACSKSHMSTSENEPVDFVYKDGHMVGVVSDYWDFVLTGAAGKTGGVYLPSYDEENDQLVWTLITEDLDDTVYTPLGLNVQIDKALAPIVSDVDTLKGDINSLNLVTTRISSDVTGLEQRVENAEGNIGQLRLDADVFDVRMSDAEGNIGQLALTAREFSVEMSNVQGDVGRLWLTAQEFGVRMSNAEGDVSLLKQTADEIQTRVENAEGDISQIHQRADEISSQVENAQGDISRIEQRADSIESTVQDAQGDISQLKQTATEISTRVENNEGDISRISQRADAIESTVENAQGDISQLRQTATEISSTVATNKELADGAIAENRSLISQTAEEIRSEVESNVTRLDGEIEQSRSEIRQTAEEITSTVERNKQETDGAIESAKSEFKQTADEISATVERNKADTDGQIETTRSEIRQTADSITSTVEANKRAVDGSILELNSTITQTAEEIKAEVSRVETDVNGNIEDAKSEMKQTADEISATVARNKAESDGSFQSVSSQLSIQADQIQSTVGSIESVEDRVTTSESNITQLSDEISTKVSQTDFNTKTQQIESSVSAIDQKADGIRASVTTLSGTVDANARAFSDYATATDAELVEMQKELDGAIESWFYEGVPTLNNLPASNWSTTEDKNVHLGDLYYDKVTGYAYRFVLDNGVYKWIQIEDDAVAKALADAARAQDTADNKRRVFITQPTPPYDAGDLWVQGHTANNDGVIFRCINSRQSGTFISSDWELASDSVTSKIARSNFEVLSNAIVGTVSSYTYDSNGVLDSATQSRISQTADAIRLSVSNGAIGTALGTNGAINSALLDTGIDITNGDITLTANHIKLQNQNAVSGLELITTGSGSSQRVVIDVSSLNVSGIFTTQAWSGTNGVRAGIISDANTYANTAAGNAQTNAINDTRSYVNSTDYLNNSVVPLITNATSGLAKDSDYNYLKAALLDGTTTVAGGLVLSSLIKLGYNAGTDEIPDWQIMSGINGVAVPAEPGKGIAAWYGGAMEDGEKSGASANAAKSLFRMDGSGYLAGGQISWSNTGSIVIHGATLQGTNGNITTGELVERILEIGSWFIKEPYIDSGGVTRYYLRLVCGDTTNLAGFASDGFVSASGLSDGGGTAGADLPAVWTSLRNINTTASEINSTIKIAEAHIPDMASTYGYLKSTDAVANVALNGDYLRVTKNGVNTDLTILYATTARYVVGDNNAASPQYALLQSGGGRQDASPEGDTWLFWDTLGGAISPWGIRHNQENNTIGIIGAGTERILLNMQTGAITGVSFVKSGGVSSQFLKADGSVDSSAYITGINSSMVTTALGYTPANSSSLANYVTLGTEQTITGRKFFTSPSSLVLQLSNNEVNNYTEGIRFNIGGANAWAGFTIGGTQVTGTGLGIWAFLVTNNDFYIGHNGSSNATYGLSWTSSGALNLKTFSLTSNGSTIWTAANDGATSGLDADLLDGQHGSYYAPAASLNNYLPLIGGTLRANDINFFNLDSTHTSGNNWIYFMASGTAKASVGYFSGLACIANEATSARIGVNDAGVPQYWNTSEGGSGHEFTIYHSGNFVAGTNYQAPISDLSTIRSNASNGNAAYNALVNYLPLAGGTMSGQLTLKDYILRFLNGSTERFLGYHSSFYDLSWYTGSAWTKVWHSGNSNLYTVPWACSTLTASGQITATGTWASGIAGVKITNNTTDTIPWLFNSLAPNMPTGTFSAIIHGVANSTNNAATLSFYYAGSNSANNYTGLGLYANDNILIVRGDGNIGIGTTSPAYTLDVNGSIGCSMLTTNGSISMPNNTYIGIKDSTGTENLALYYTIYNQFFVGRGPAEAGHDVFVCGNNLYLTYGTSRTTGILLNSSGNVGIGTTSPSQALHVVGSIFSTGEVISNTDNSFRIICGNYGSFWRNDGASTYLLMTASGDQYGSFNSLRPFYVNNSTGDVTMGHNVSILSRLYVTNTAEIDCDSGNWTYLRLWNGSTAWDVASGNHGLGMLGTANTFEIRQGGGNVGLAVRYGTSAYGKLVVVTGDGESSIGYWSTSRNKIAGYPIWTVGYTGDTSDNFGWYFAGTTQGWKLLLSPEGNLAAVGTVAAGVASDERLKTNIQTLSTDSAKDIILKARPVNFTWKDIATELYDGYKGNDIGLIAQEVEELLPQAIGTIYEKYKRLDYTKFIPPIITVVQDHEKRIRELEDENKRLKELLKINEYANN